MLDLEGQLSRYGQVLDREAQSSVRVSELASPARRSSNVRKKVLVAAAIVVVVGTAVVALRSSNDQSVHTPPATDTNHVATSPENGVSWVLPDSWQASAVVAPDVGSGTDDLSAVELLAAGTTGRPEGLGGVLCGATPPDPTQVFVSLREFPGGPQPGMPPRPHEFAPVDASPTVLPYCENPATVEVLRTAFTERDRGFLVYVLIGSQASIQTQSEAWKMLDSLDIASYEQPSTTVAAQITNAFESAATSNDPAVARAAIDQPDRLPAGVRDKIGELSNSGSYKIDVRDIGLDGDVARVQYRLGTTTSDASNDASALASGYGYAVQRDGTWRVTLDTACGWIQTLGVACPAVTAAT